MPKYLALAALLASPFLLATTSATACERGPSRPVETRPVSLTEKAERLVREALANEREADSLTVDASRLSVRANALRDRASRLVGQARAETLAEAAGLDRDAADERAEAADLRLVAARLRDQARELTRLASNTGSRPPGWRGRIAVD